MRRTERETSPPVLSIGAILAVEEALPELRTRRLEHAAVLVGPPGRPPAGPVQQHGHRPGPGARLAIVRDLDVVRDGRPAHGGHSNRDVDEVPVAQGAEEVGLDPHAWKPTVDVGQHPQPLQQRGFAEFQEPEHRRVVPRPGRIGVRPLDASLHHDGCRHPPLAGLAHRIADSVRASGKGVASAADRGGRMDVGIGLPSAVPGTDGAVLLDWARRADGGPVAGVGVLDRVLYDSYDPFVALASAAAVTERVRLVTMVAIGPLRPTALLAKQAAAL